VVNELKEIGIESIYHKIKNEQHGKEITPTLFFQRKIKRPYHIDYVFAPEKYIKRTQKFEIGQPDKWLKLSDHMPILVEFK
jgi:endonuclease/exonuclease/phosphatase (EEP) superfamily protein YafD